LASRVLQVDSRHIVSIQPVVTYDAETGDTVSSVLKTCVTYFDVIHFRWGKWLGPRVCVRGLYSLVSSMDWGLVVVKYYH